MSKIFAEQNLLITIDAANVATGVPAMFAPFLRDFLFTSTSARFKLTKSTSRPSSNSTTTTSSRWGSRGRPRERSFWRKLGDSNELLADGLLLDEVVAVVFVVEVVVVSVVVVVIVVSVVGVVVLIFAVVLVSISVVIVVVVVAVVLSSC